MICIKCGQNNPHGAKFCESCNAQLPKVSHEESSSIPKVNERYMQLKNAGEKVKVGEWTVDEYSSFLDNMMNVLMQKEQEIREIEIPDEASEEFREELEAGFSGIDLYNQGIAEMRLFIDDLNSEHIDRGLQLVSDGNERINDAMRINRENRRKLEEMYQDASTFM